MKKALILEDHSLMQQVFSNILDEAFTGISVDIANTLNSSLALATNNQYDIALVDLSLPDGSGIDLILNLKLEQKNCYIVVVTIFEDETHLFHALEAGADGYLLKDQSKDILIKAMKGITAGEPPLSPTIARKLIAKFSQVASPNIDSELSERESTVLTLIAKGYRRSDTARILNITENTVAAHIKSIYKKLSISSRAEASMEAAKLGLIRYAS